MITNTAALSAIASARSFLEAADQIANWSLTDLDVFERLGRDLHAATRTFVEAEPSDVPRPKLFDGAPSSLREVARLLGLSGDDATRFVDTALQLADPGPWIIVAGRGPDIESARLRSISDEVTRSSASVTFSVPLNDARSLGVLLGREVTLAVTEKR